MFKRLQTATLLLGAATPLILGQATQASEPVRIQFQGMVGDEMFSCSASYPELGASGTAAAFTDFRFYVSEVALIDESGNVVPVALEQDGMWQHESVALLDFEDQTGACSNGTPEMRTEVVGTVPSGNYTGVMFTLGVPFALNHDDATLAPSPLNLTAMWWNWQGGYKFARIDIENAAMNAAVPSGPQTRSLPAAATAAVPGQDAGHIAHGAGHDAHGAGHDAHGAGHNDEDGHSMAQGFLIHLGSTGCQLEGDSQQPTFCSNPNRTSFVFTGFDPEQNVIVADVAALVAESTLTTNQPDTPLGCMSSPEDGDCTAILHNFGLSHSEEPSSGQTFFRVQ